MSLQREVIVNADDFGLSAGVNAGIIRAHERGIVTSASLMVRGADAAEAAAYGRQHPEFSVGLHVDLCEWVFTDGEWRVSYEVVDLENADAVAHETERQLDVFRDLMGRDPTHLDSHQHVHRNEPVLSIMSHLARSLGIVLREFNPTVRYVGSFYGQCNQGKSYPNRISVEALIVLLKNLGLGVTELGCHPGEDANLNSVYRAERFIECWSLCDQRVRTVLEEEDIKLCSFLQAPALTES